MVLAVYVVFFFICLFVYLYESTVAVFRHTRRGHRIPLQMVVSYHVVVKKKTKLYQKEGEDREGSYGRS